MAHADSGGVVWSQWLNADITRTIVSSIGRLCTGIHFDADSRNRNPQEVIAAIEDDSAIVESAPSVFAIFGAEKGEEIERVLAGLAGVSHTLMAYEDDETLRCTQVVDACIDKQYGIVQMLRHGNLASQRRLAIGDGINDFALFAAAGEDGIRVAMGNAPDELKKMADWVAPPVNRHGFVAAMERYGLIG